MGETDTVERVLIKGLDALAVSFERSDPHIRHEAEIMAKQNISYVVEEIQD